MKTKEQMVNELRAFVAQNFMTDTAPTRQKAELALSAISDAMEQVVNELDGHAWMLRNIVTDETYKEGMY